MNALSILHKHWSLKHRKTAPFYSNCNTLYTTYWWLVLLLYGLLACHSNYMHMMHGQIGILTSWLWISHLYKNTSNRWWHFKVILVMHHMKGSARVNNAWNVCMCVCKYMYALSYYGDLLKLLIQYWHTVLPLTTKMALQL